MFHSIENSKAEVFKDSLLIIKYLYSHSKSLFGNYTRFPLLEYFYEAYRNMPGKKIKIMAIQKRGWTYYLITPHNSSVWYSDVEAFGTSKCTTEPVKWFKYKNCTDYGSFITHFYLWLASILGVADILFCSSQLEILQIKYIIIFCRYVAFQLVFCKMFSWDIML